MIRQKRLAKWGVIFCVLCLVTACVGIPAGAVQENGDVTGIEVEPPSAEAPQSQGKADIEEYFTETDGPAADEDVPAQTSVSPGYSGRELPITYDEQQSDASETAETAEADTGQQKHVLLYIIPAVAVLVLFGIFNIHTRKVRKGVKR